MTEDNENETNDEQKPRTFTQEQVNKLLADQKRTVSAKFGDYDDLKLKAGKLDQIQQESQTELEKALDRATKAEATVASYEAKKQADSWAAEIVKGSDIPASVLRGSTREELEAHFEQLKSLTPKAKRTPVPSGKSDGKSGSRAVEALRLMRQG